MHKYYLEIKLETIFSRGSANTRMRDFYDIYIIFSMYNNMIDINLLKQAVEAVANHRNTTEILKNIKQGITEIESSYVLEKLWTSYGKKYSYAQEITWGMIISELKENMKNVLLG